MKHHGDDAGSSWPSVAEIPPTLPDSQRLKFLGIHLQQHDTSQKKWVLHKHFKMFAIDVVLKAVSSALSQLIRRTLPVGIARIDSTIANPRIIIGTFVSHYRNPTGSGVCVYATGPRRIAEEWIVWVAQDGAIMEAVFDQQTEVYTHRYFLGPDAIPEEIARAALSALLRLASRPIAHSIRP